MEKEKHIDYLIIDWNNQKAIVIGVYTEGTPDVRYLPNGDPGYPGDPEEFDIHEIIINNKKMPRDEIDKIYDDDEQYEKFMIEINNTLANIEENNAIESIKKNCLGKKCKQCKDYEYCETQYYRKKTKKEKII
ncbi:MAG: hypothetical protein PHP92_04000 [Candidatus Nanoarchaeia archaeon]|nr:hypothetical protein [Candidatus Nanoarchaeia archaeon]